MSKIIDIEHKSMVEITLPGDSKRSGPPSIAELPMSGARAQLRPLASVKGAVKRRKGPLRVSLASSVHSTGEIDGCVAATFDLLEIFGMDRRNGQGPKSESVRRSYNQTLKHWRKASEELGEGGWMKFAKWKFAAFFFSHTSQVFPQDGPPCPLGVGRDCAGQLCCGSAGRFALRLVRSRLSDEFLASILQVKKGCPRPGKKLVEAQVQKSKAALTTKQPSKPVTWLRDWAEVDEKFPVNVPLVNSRENHEEQLRRTVDEIVDVYLAQHPDGYCAKSRYDLFFPSTSASSTNTVDEGGAYMDIHELAQSEGLVHDLKFHPGRISKPHPPVKVHYRTSEEEEHIGAPRVRIQADMTDLEATFGDFYERTMKRAIKETPSVTPVGLAESLKVRVITKGPAYTGFVLKSIQKFLWKMLRSHPVFALIGKPVDRWEILNRLGMKLPDDEFYLSGDYSAATDNLAPWVSESIARRLSLRLGFTSDEETLFVRALTQHVFYDDQKVALPQQWGQLMGSVVSFPVLCIANAAMCRWSIEVAFQKVLSLKQTTLMINGDDCAFRTTKLGLQVWKEITSFGGLSPSVGKFFASRSFVQINSTNFIRLEVPLFAEDPVTGKRREMPFSQTPYVNLGLLYGLKRSGEVVGVDSVVSDTSSLGSRASELLKCCPPELTMNLYKIFLLHHKKVLQHVSPSHKAPGITSGSRSVRMQGTTVPWYMPESWGGVGLPIIQGTKHVPTDLDRRVAARLQERPDQFPVSRPPVDAMWTTHKNILKRLPEGQLSSAPHDVEVYNRVYRGLAVEQLFQNVQVMRSEDEMVSASKRRLQLLRRNEKSWNNARRNSGGLPPPLSIATIISSSPPKLVPVMDVSSIYSEFDRPVSTSKLIHQAIHDVNAMEAEINDHRSALFERWTIHEVDRLEEPINEPVRLDTAVERSEVKSHVYAPIDYRTQVD